MSASFFLFLRLIWFLPVLFHFRLIIIICFIDFFFQSLRFWLCDLLRHMFDLAKLLIWDHNCFCFVIHRRQRYEISLWIDQRMLQICDHILHILITAIHTFLCTFQNDLLQTVGKLRCINTWRNNLFLKMFDSNSYCGISVKRNLPCNHFIHCDTQWINITLLITVSASDLFRWTVMNRSHYIWAYGIGRSGSCNTKICYFYLSIHGNDNILRFYITMYNPMAVCSFQSHGDLDRNTGCFFYRKLSLFGNVLLESNSLNKLHNNVINSVIVTNIKYIHYIRMCQDCCSLSLTFKLADKRRILSEFRLKNFYSNKPIQLMVFCLVYVRHSAGTNFS